MEHDGAKAKLCIESLYSGLSRGTERLVFEGRLPESEWTRMRAPLQHGDFPFPVRYGYAAVGRVEDGPDALIGRTVFALHPHQTRFAVPVNMAIPIPDHIPPRRAILAANMETALNAIWDSGAAAGNRIAVIGGGLVGLLITRLATRIPGAQVTLIDINPERAQYAGLFGAAFRHPDEAGQDYQIIFHTSATQDGLRLALGIAGFEARIIEVSWFGDKDIALPLGGAFHSQRLQIVSSQVGHVAAPVRFNFTHRQRLATALMLLDDADLDSLITEDVAFKDLPAELPRLLAADAKGVATAIRY
ncbi:MAG: zinc-binding alcohol dehydrogenase [Hyphomicrobiales bacterium]|nr:zinc-binding alcohol dehydrogenase [Hyphomicrobiales bacterium]